MTEPIRATDLTVPETETLRTALALLDKTAQGIIFAVNAKGKMVGVLTDGDVRRALLKGAKLSSPIDAIIKRDFISLPISATRKQITKQLSDPISHIPLLDQKGVPVDFASKSRLHRIPVMEPVLGEEELANVMECLKTNWISSQGKFVTEFESKFEKFHGGGFALTVSNGTAALHLALTAMGIGPGDEVIVPDLTFAASANAVIHTGAKPVFVDITEDTWTLDPDALADAYSPRTKAIMPVHLYGHPCDMDPIISFAKKHKLLIIEDSAESFGAEYKGKKIGTLGDAAAFSFFGNKLITTGEGGMILFKDKSLFEKAKRLRDHGMDPKKRYWHNEVGFNYRLTNLQAAVGVAQMNRAQEFIDRKIENASRYLKLFDEIPGIQPPQTASWAKNVYWLYTVRITDDAPVSRDQLMQRLLHNGIESRPIFYPLHEMPPYKQYAKNKKFPITTRISKEGISLPSSAQLKPEEIKRICRVFQDAIGLRELVKTARDA